jgi:chorismate mutase
MMRGIRGAITIEVNQKDHIENKTEILLREMIQQNHLQAESIASIFISVTDDIDAGFPAAAARRIAGFTYVPIMCMREIPVPGSLPMAIRIMIHANIDTAQKDIKHIYLEGAKILRPDLKEK